MVYFYKKYSAQMDITIEKTGKSRLPEINFEEVVFGKTFSDHMFIMDYADGEWYNARIIPFQNISVNPAFLSLHYGQSIFEGMKAHKSNNGDPVLFRPEENFKRLNQSAERLCMPTIDVDTVVDALCELVDIDRNWIPDTEGGSLYIRPFMYATDEYIGVRPSFEYSLVIFTCPVNSYYDKPVSVKVETHYSRAVEGGVGNAKVAGNYAAALYPTKLANEQGFDQLIWTDAKEHKYIEESGTMNLMVIIDDTIVTPPAGDTILGGITRKSVLQLAKDLGYKVEERKLAVKEVVDAQKEGRLKDMFGTGTAVTITHIKAFSFEGTTYELPPNETRTISTDLKNRLEALKRGNTEDKYGWIVKI